MRALPNPYAAGTDEHFIFEALQLAHRGLGWTSPNPPVGALIVRDGKVIGQGWHSHDGEEHAEARALADAGDSRGATCYVSLEPCTHAGRQPPCCTLLAQAGVARTVWGCDDADERTAGLAAGVLTASGITAQGGVLASDCARFLDHYLVAHLAGSPFVHLKLALSLDGKAACAGGHSQWLSGPVSLGYAHYLRQRHDAVLIGYRSVLYDDPRLSTRREAMQPYRELAPGQAPRNPVRVVLDPRFELVLRLGQLRLADFSGQFRERFPKLIIAGDAACAPVGFRETAEVTLLPLTGAAAGRLDFAPLFSALWALGIRSVLAEGGPGLARELLRQRSVHKLSLVHTPLLIGADGLGFTGEMSCAEIGQCPRLHGARAEVLGADTLSEGYPPWALAVLPRGILLGA